MRKTLFVLIALCIYLNIYGQCNEDLEYNVIINEIGSYVTKIEDTDEHINDEFIELLVLGNPSKPFADVNLAGMIIDDNNRSGFAIGNEPGHIRIGDEFPLVPPGSLILIYNQKSTEFDFMSDGLPNDLGVFKLPLSSEYLKRISTSPTNNSETYSNSQDYNSDPKWNNYIPYRNFGDVAQIRKPNGDFIHALGWYDQEIGLIDMPNHTLVFPGRLKDESIKFVGDNPKINTGFTKSSLKSPGYPNNDINENYINNIKAGVIPSFTLSLKLISSQSSNNLDGEIQYTISSYSPGDRVIVFFNGQLYGEVGNGVYTIGSLAAGEYTILIEDESGNCTLEESISVPLKETIEEVSCDGECITLSAFDQDINENIINQSPCISWLDENNNVLAFGASYEVCPTGTTTYIQYIENESELTEIILTYIVTIYSSEISVSLSTTPIGNGICTASGITIQSIGDDIESYLWSTSETSSSIAVEMAGEYTLTVTDKNGCTAEATLILDSEDFEIGDSDGDGICDEDDLDPDDPCVPDGEDSDGDGLCDNVDCFPNDSGQTFSIGDACDDGNASTISDEINSACMCEGTPDPDNPCNGNDIDGDGICDDDDPNPNDPCDPNGEDSDSDGLCDNADCFPNDDKLTFSIGDGCDDGNASTIGDKINSECVCEGTPDPDNPCNGNDIDGDGICDDEDPFPEDSCNELKVTVSGDLTLCSGDEDAILNADITGGIEPFTIEWSNGAFEAETTVNISDGDIYKVTVTDKIGCEIETTVYIKVQEMRINISPDVIGLCPLTNEGKEVECLQDFDTYLWESEGQPSQTTKTALIDVTGDWTLTVTKEADGIVCTAMLEFHVFDLGLPAEIEKYLNESGFYSVPITFDPTTTAKNGYSVDSRYGCSDVEDFRFSGVDEENFDFIDPDVFNSIATDVLKNFKVLTNYTEDQSQLFTVNDCLCDQADISDLEEEFDVGQVSVWMHQFKNADEDIKGKLFLKAKMPYSEVSPVDEEHRDYLSGAKHDRIIQLGMNGSTDEHSTVLLKNLFMTKPFTGFGEVDLCSHTFEPTDELNFMTPAAIPVQLSTDITKFAFSDGEGLLEEGILIYYENEDLEYRSYQYDNFIHAGYYSDDTGEFFCEGSCPSCDDDIKNQGEEDIDCGGLNCEPCSDCYNGVTDGNETWADCGPTCPCSNTCDNGVFDGCETDIDCGGPCCPPCNNPQGDPGSDDECSNDWDCPAIGYECVNGECILIECDPDAFFSECNIGETCLDGVCVVECDDDIDCPIGYICGPEGICIEEEDDPPTDDCFPDCEAPDYECFNGNCIYVGNPVSDCSPSSPCPQGQYCDDGDCTNCPIITYNATYGNNDDCKFEIFLYSSHYILANIKVYRNITTLLNDYSLALSNWNPLELTYQVPNDCEEYYFSFEITFENCQINTIEIGPFNCTGSCLMNDDTISNNLINDDMDTDIYTARSEKFEKNSNESTSAQGLISMGIKCYPNPTMGLVNLFSSNLLLDRLEIYNVVGQKQLALNFEKQMHLQQLDINQLKPGIYFLKVFDSNYKFQLIKIVKN